MLNQHYHYGYSFGLYSSIIGGEKIKDQLFDRDRFVMSKGHAGAALYAVLAEKGIINKDVNSLSKWIKSFWSCFS